MPKHQIIINIQDDCPDSIESGLPKNWKLVFRTQGVDSDDPFAKYDEGNDDYYTESMLSGYSGEFVAPKLSHYELIRLYKLVEEQIKTYGRNQFRSTLDALEKCVGY